MAKKKAYRSSKDKEEKKAEKKVEKRTSNRKPKSSKRRKKRESGTIKWFKSRRGFGFIIREDEEADELFFEKDALKDEDYKPKKGDDVTFIFEELEKGPAATEIEFEEPEKKKK